MRAYPAAMVANIPRGGDYTSELSAEMQIARISKTAAASMSLQDVGAGYILNSCSGLALESDSELPGWSRAKGGALRFRCPIGPGQSNVSAIPENRCPKSLI